MMEEKLPIKRLSRLTCLQSVIIGFIFYVVVLHYSNTEKKGFDCQVLD